MEQCSGPAETGILDVDPFDISVATGLEQLHQHRFGRLGLVYQRLRADLVE